MRNPTYIWLISTALLWMCSIPASTHAQQEASAGMAAYLKQQIHSHLAQTYPDSTHRYEIQLKRLPHTLRSISRKQVQRVSYAGRGMPTGYSTFDVYYSRGNRETQSKAQFLIKVWQKLPVAKTRIQREKAIKPEDLTYRWVQLNSGSGSFIKKRNEVEGYVATRMIQQGRPLHKSYLSKPMVVEAGDTVTLNLYNGGLKLTLECVARQSAPKGETVRVFSSQTRKTYSAKVISEGTVRWLKTH